MTVKIHVASTAVLGALVCLLAASQEPNRSPPERSAAPPLALAQDSLPKSTAEAKAAPVRSPPPSAPKTVAERKAETLEAMRKRELVPAGHGSPAPAP